MGTIGWPELMTIGPLLCIGVIGISVALIVWAVRRKPPAN